MKIRPRRLTYGYEPADDAFHIREPSTGTNIAISREEADGLRLKHAWNREKFMRMLRVVDRLVNRP